MICARYALYRRMSGPLGPLHWSGKFRSHRHSNRERPARSKSLDRPCHPGHLKNVYVCVAICSSRTGLINQADDGSNSVHDVFLGLFSFNFNLFCVHLMHRICDPSDMELVNTEIRLQIIHDVRYN